MSLTALMDVDVSAVMARGPVIIGHSKRLYAVSDDQYLVQLVPSLSSFTFNRYENVPGTEVLRLDFYERAAARLAAAGLPMAFRRRLGPDLFLADRCTEPPFEIIVKNVAGGSTTKKYPGLFTEGYRFSRPVVKFDYRIDPEDQAIADDYLREAGCDPAALKELALAVNSVLRTWLAPRDLLDFCIIVGTRPDGSYAITSEVSPDGMRLRSADGSPLDKDLFRRGADHATIMRVWSDLVADLDAAQCPRVC